MSKRPQFRLVVLSFAACCASLAAQRNRQPNQKLWISEFQSAVAQYDAGNFAEAAAQLEKLSYPTRRKASKSMSFSGLVYAAQSKDAKAVEQLQIAVRLKPDSAAAQNQSGSEPSSTRESQTRPESNSARRSPWSRDDFEANHNLAEFYIQSGKIAEALPLLEKAQRDQSLLLRQWLRPGAGLFPHRAAQRSRASLSRRIVQQKNTGELHNLLGQDRREGRKVRRGGK